MFARIVVTGFLLFLSAYAFWDDALGGGHLLNPSGIAFLVLSGCVWLGWESVGPAFKSVRNESNIPIIRLGSAIIRGMCRAPQPHRKSDEQA